MKKFVMTAGLALALAAGSAQAGVVVAAANSKLPAMNADAVKRAFMGRDPAVQVVYQKGGATRSAFDSGVLGKAGAELTSYWSRLIFTGKAKAPAEVDGDAGVKARLASNPNAVGYISDGAVDGSVKVLFKF